MSLLSFKICKKTAPPDVLVVMLGVKVFVDANLLDPWIQ